MLELIHTYAAVIAHILAVIVSLQVLTAVALFGYVHLNNKRQTKILLEHPGRRSGDNPEDLIVGDVPYVPSSED